MKKLLVIVSMLLVLLTGCGGDDTQALTEIDDSQLGGLAQAAKDQAEVNQAADTSSAEEEEEFVDTAEHVIINEGTDIELDIRVGSIPDVVDIYDPASIYYRPETFSDLPCISDYQAMDLGVYQYDDSYYNHWYAITDVYLTGRENEMNYYSQWGVNYYVNNSASQEIFEKVLETDEPVTIVGYCVTTVDGVAFQDCIIVDDIMYNIYNNIEMRNDGITSPPSDSYDNYYNEDPNTNTIQGQIMDGFVGAMQEAADTPEEQEFANAYGEAWNFIESLYGY